MLLGLQDSAQLRRVISNDLQPIASPPEDLLLTTKLAEILGVVPGQTITVEVLEGTRPVRDIPVTSTIDELVGLAAYMDQRALHRLMNEGETTSGAFLMVDSPAIPKLYSELKQTPAVSAVSIPETARASFDETIAKTINVSSVILIAFAMIIAFGMVYNGSRIALSERGHELSSLRVLGFTVRVDAAEVSRGPMLVNSSRGVSFRTAREMAVRSLIRRNRPATEAATRGDNVVQRQLIAEIEPLPLAPLDPRQRAEAIGRVRAAEDAKAEVDRMVERYKASYDQTRRDLKRSETLARDGVISRQEIEEAETAVATSLREYEAVRSRAERAAHDVEVAKGGVVGG